MADEPTTTKQPETGYPYDEFTRTYDFNDRIYF